MTTLDDNDYTRRPLDSMQQIAAQIPSALS